VKRHYTIQNANRTTLLLGVGSVLGLILASLIVFVCRYTIYCFFGFWSLLFCWAHPKFIHIWILCNTRSIWF